MRIIWRCLIALAVIWSLAAGAIVIVNRTRPTPQKFISYVTEHPLEGLGASERAAIVERAARLLNGLNTEQRREVKSSGILRTFFLRLDSEERRRFASLTLPAGFRQMIVTLNKMNPTQRKTVVERTLRDLRTQSQMANDLGGEDDIRVMLSRGAAIFDEEATPEVKADFAPVFEEFRSTHQDISLEVAPQKQ